MSKSDDTINRRDVINAILALPPAESKTKCIVQIKIDRDDMEDLVNEMAKEIADPKTDDENELKFYYVESLDDYWVGRRLDNFYYANWHEGLGFVWSHSRYLPWGEHIVDENTLWKEHTYPSEPIEISFTEWIVGFAQKYFARPKTGKWTEKSTGGEMFSSCSVCGYVEWDAPKHFCPNCGADMRGEEE